MKQLSTYLRLGLGMFLFGSGTPVSKLVTEAFPVFLASGLRMLIALLVFLPVLFLQKDEIQKLNKKDALLIVLIGLIGMFAFSVFMLYGMRRVSGVVGSVIMSTTPAITAFASFLILKEKMDGRKWVAIALAVAGVLIMNLTRQGNPSDLGNEVLIVGSLLVFGAVFSEAAFTLLGNVMSKKIKPILTAGLTTAVAIILFIPFAAYQAYSFDWRDVEWQTLLPLIWWGLGTMALGTYLWYSGLKKATGAEAAGFMGLMPLSALTLSYVLLNESFEWIHLLGFGLVFIGVLLVAWSHAKRSQGKRS